jgi:branched-chain amino acid transport system substrate-binding protein
VIREDKTGLRPKVTRGPRWARLVFSISAIAVIAGLLAACGGDDEGDDDSSSPIVIGASVPLSGPLGPLGQLITPGYKIAVDEVNAEGGLDVGGEKRQVELMTLDSKSDPTTGANQIRQLVNDNGAVALFGSVTDLVVPQSAAADALRIPYVTSLDPPQIWETQAPEGGWQYAWDFHFAITGEGGAIPAEFAALETIPTNKKLALVANNAADGQAWKEAAGAEAPKTGYEVVADATYPTGTTDFASFINDAKSAGADIVIAQLPPPDGIALWKQMASLGYRPKAAFCEKCANDSPWAAGLGDLAEGTLATGQWSPEQGFPHTEELVSALNEAGVPPADHYLSAFTYSVAQVMFDAMERAGTTDPEAVNEEIGNTDDTYTVGPIKFNEQHGSNTPTVILQWQGGTTVQVFPAIGDSKIVPPAL